jgi:hypothetical protein
VRGHDVGRERVLAKAVLRVCGRHFRRFGFECLYTKQMSPARRVNADGVKLSVVALATHSYAAEIGHCDTPENMTALMKAEGQRSLASGNQQVHGERLPSGELRAAKKMLGLIFSADPDGPWSAPQMVPGTDVYADSNFAPWIDSDGSLVALTRGQVYRSSNWRNISDYRAVGRCVDRGEDPFIWRNSVDGVLHGIIHVGRPNTFGLHLYSTDGTSWTASAGHAYTSVLSFTNGTELNLASKQTHPTHPPARPPLTLDNPSWALGNLSRPSTGLAGAVEASEWSGRPHIGLDTWSPNINSER